jgi:hypothetical protein
MEASDTGNVIQGVRQISPSTPSIRFSPVAHTLLLRSCLSWALRILSICIRRFNFN